VDGHSIPDRDVGPTADDQPLHEVKTLQLGLASRDLRQISTRWRWRPTEIDHAVILHLLAEMHFRRVETFASLASLEAFLARTDLRVVSRMAQEVIQAIFPDLAAEEIRAIAA
jgi:hypothetical protein